MSHAIRSLALAAALAALAPMASQAAALSSLSFSLTNNGSFSSGDPITELKPGATISGAIVFILNGDIGLTFSGSGPITITIDPTLYNLNALTLSRFSGEEVEVSVNGVAAPKLGATPNFLWKQEPLVRSCPAGTTCEDELLTEGSDPWITEIVFRRDPADLVGFNGLVFTQIGSTGGGTVPEPAGYGLAAMALLAAGAATRRRNAR